MKRTKTKLIVLLVLVFAASLIAGIASLFSVKAYAEESSYGYYYEQLTTNEEKAFYSALADMKSQDVFKSGTETWNLVEKGYLENKGYNQTTLTEAFGAGRDAFMLDNSDLFYVDFDKISVRMLTDGSNYKITLGIGRYDNYFADGFDLTNVDKAIADFESIVNKIVDGADGYLGVNNKILYVYETVMDNAVYSLEFDAGDDADYVRCAYGVLVKGKGVCQSFSQAVNIILNKLGIENVLVQGMFIDDDGNEQPHMWNNVVADDNRWYILDATMDNALRDGYDENALEYFLLNGTAAAGLYVPDGVISTSGFEFTYPSLCMVDYQSPSGSFTIETATTENGVEYNNVSYNGMGLRSAENAGYYLLFTYDITSESVWYYVSNYIDYFTIPNTENFDIDDYDFEGYLNCLFLGSKTSYILAVTTDAPSDTTLSNYVNYIGGNILEKSNAVVYDETQAAPYAVTVTPDALRFYIGSSYNVTITFSDELVKEDSTKEVTLRYIVGSGVTLNSANTVISNFKWSESTPNQISFTFTPDKNYSADRCDYTFELDNLVGKTSGKTPVDTILFAMYKPSFSCPVNPLSYCTAVASVPQLISDGDLSVNGWIYTDENGNVQTVSGNSLSNKISLVATTYSEDENKEYENEVNAYNEDNGDNVNILSSATYDLSLNLCDMQVKYLNGEKVMIMVPFPDGYSADSAGVNFKAYHFADDGSVEEIDCYCTEYGIILFCSSFSDYTVAAVESDGTDVKTVLIAAEGNGAASSASGEKFIKVEKDGKLSVTISADSDYCIDSISVNGKIITLDGAASYTLEKEYADLDDNTTIIVSFAYAEVVNGEIAEGFKLATEDISANNGNTILIAILAVLAVLVVAAVAISVAIFIKRRKHTIK